MASKVAASAAVLAGVVLSCPMPALAIGPQMLTIVAGNVSYGSPTPGSATATTLGYPNGVAVDSDGNLYIADSGNDQVYKVNTAGNISVLAGTGSGGPPVEGPATSSPLDDPYDLDGTTWHSLATSTTSGGRLTATVSGLDNGTAYSLRVRAVNLVGSSVSNPTAAVTPAVALAVTGAAVTSIVGAGVVLLTLGLGLVRMNQRRRPA